MQYIKGIANILADSASRLRAVGLYHNLDFRDGEQELRTPFEPLPPVEQSTYMPIEGQDILIKSGTENLTQNYDKKTLPVTQTEEFKLSISNSTAKNYTFCNYILQHK